jgi:hypothetical protein
MSILHRVTTSVVCDRRRRALLHNVPDFQCINETPALTAIAVSIRGVQNDVPIVSFCPSMTRA